MAKVINPKELYSEKVTRTTTSSGLPAKAVYRPEDIASFDYNRDLGDPGEYPFTRGVYPDMYQGRLWSRRQISGYDSGDASNERLKFLLESGESAINIIPDCACLAGLDSDHPIALGDVGLQGIPFTSIKDMEELMEGISLADVSFTISGPCYPVLAFYLGLAKDRRIELSQLRGTLTNDPLQYVAGFGGDYLAKVYGPPKLALRVAVDIMEYCAQNVPLWNPFNVVMYNMRECRITAVEEIAFGLATAREYLQESLRRGTDIDTIAPKIAFNNNCNIDIFEEAAKFRAARRIWAKMMKEEFGAKNPRSWIYKFHCNTAGSAMARPEPLNNAIRAAYMALAAVLGGVQSMDVTPYLEPLSLPTEEAHLLAVRTQQILAYETGVAAVADPLGGSYYVENLTNRLEAEILKLQAEIEAEGGWVAAIEKGLVRCRADESSYRYQKEIESGHRAMVGVNKFVLPDKTAMDVRIHRPNWETINRHIDSVKALKQGRDREKTKVALEGLYNAAKTSGENIMPAMINAAQAFATNAEIRGAIRMAYDLPYDIHGKEKYPFENTG